MRYLIDEEYHDGKDVRRLSAHKDLWSENSLPPYNDVDTSSKEWAYQYWADSTGTHATRLPTIKFDSENTDVTEGNLKSSYVRNVVLKYQKPQLISDNTNYISFIPTDEYSIAGAYIEKYHIDLILKDRAGLDAWAVDIFQMEKNETPPTGEILSDNVSKLIYKQSRKKIVIQGEDPFEDYDIPEDLENLKYTVSSLRNVSGYSVSKINENDDSFRIVFDLYAHNGYFDKTTGICNPKGYYENIDDLNSKDLWIRLWDIAGNSYDYMFEKLFFYIPYTREQWLEYMQPLKIYFDDVHTPSMFLMKDQIGSCDVYIEDPNYRFWTDIWMKNNELCSLSDNYNASDDKYCKAGYANPYSNVKINYYLDDSSLGTIAYNSHEDIGEGADGEFAVSFHVGGIQNLGYVIVHAFLSGIPDLELNEELKLVSSVREQLGKWTAEDPDNTRRIIVDPFIPEALQGERIAEFCKLLEDMWNTLYYRLDGDYKIGILEKAERIGQFKEIDECEPELIGKFAEEHGSEMDIDLDSIEILTSSNATLITPEVAEYMDELKSLQAEVVKYGALNVDSATFRRTLYRALPYINAQKGTHNLYNILFFIFGLGIELKPLWLSKNGGFIEEKDVPEEDKKYYLSSHFSINITTNSAKNVLDAGIFLIRLVKSVIPVNRVLDKFEVTEWTKPCERITLSDYHNTTSNLGLPRYLKFKWNPNRWYSYHDGSNVSLTIPITADYAEFVDGITDFCDIKADRIIDVEKYGMTPIVSDLNKRVPGHIADVKESRGFHYPNGTKPTTISAYKDFDLQACPDRNTWGYFEAYRKMLISDPNKLFIMAFGSENTLEENYIKVDSIKFDCNYVIISGVSTKPTTNDEELEYTFSDASDSANAYVIFHYNKHNKQFCYPIAYTNFYRNVRPAYYDSASKTWKGVIPYGIKQFILS